MIPSLRTRLALCGLTVLLLLSACEVDSNPRRGPDEQLRALDGTSYLKTCIQTLPISRGGDLFGLQDQAGQIVLPTRCTSIIPLSKRYVLLFAPELDTQGWALLDRENSQITSTGFVGHHKLANGVLVFSFGSAAHGAALVTQDGLVWKQQDRSLASLALAPNEASARSKDLEALLCVGETRFGLLEGNILEAHDLEPAHSAPRRHHFILRDLGPEPLAEIPETRGYALIWLEDEPCFVVTRRASQSTIYLDSDGKQRFESPRPPLTFESPAGNLLLLSDASPDGPFRCVEPGLWRGEEPSLDSPFRPFFTLARPSAYGIIEPRSTGLWFDLDFGAEKEQLSQDQLAIAALFLRSEDSTWRLYRLDGQPLDSEPWLETGQFLLSDSIRHCLVNAARGQDGFWRAFHSSGRVLQRFRAASLMALAEEMSRELESDDGIAVIEASRKSEDAEWQKRWSDSAKDPVPARTDLALEAARELGISNRWGQAWLTRALENSLSELETASEARAIALRSLALTLVMERPDDKSRELLKKWTRALRSILPATAASKPGNWQLEFLSAQRERWSYAYQREEQELDQRWRLALPIPRFRRSD